VLDYGCGSGILAIAAMKLGAGSAYGVDVDAQAVQSSRDNALATGQGEFSLPDGTLQPATSWLPTSSLTAQNARTAAGGRHRQGGRIVLSGVLSDRLKM